MTDDSTEGGQIVGSIAYLDPTVRLREPIYTRPASFIQLSPTACTNPYTI